MWIVAIAWMYVAVLMAAAEATNANGSILGAIITFFLYGLAPMALVMYLLGTPARRKARKKKEHDEWISQQARSASASAADPDGSAHAAGDASVAAERKEP